MVGMAMIYFCPIGYNRTDSTDVHGLLVKKMPGMAMIYFCPIGYNRTDCTDLHGLFVKNAHEDGDDFFSALMNIIARIAQIYTDYLGKMRTRMMRMGMIFFYSVEYNRTDCTDLHR